MSLRADVEVVARALGVWRDDTEPLDAGALAIMPLHSSMVRVKVGADRTDVDASTAALILLGHARGLRVDVGECPDCRERGSKRGIASWEWTQREWASRWPVPVDRTWTRFDPLLADWVPGSVSECAFRPCPACTVDGEPTGRHTLAWERAILDAQLRRDRFKCEAERMSYGRMPDGERQAWAVWKRRGWRFGNHVDDNDMLTWTHSGDPATRTALTVLADQAQARGDKLGDMLAWWIAGPDVLARHEAELSQLVQLAAIDLHLAAV